MNKIIRIIILIIDSSLFIFFTIYIITQFDINALPLQILVLTLLFLNIYLIKTKSFPKSKPKKSWFKLYLKRKALEEQKKIDELSSK